LGSANIAEHTALTEYKGTKGVLLLWTYHPPHPWYIGTYPPRSRVLRSVGTLGWARGRWALLRPSPVSVFAAECLAVSEGDRTSNLEGTEKGEARLETLLLCQKVGAVSAANERAVLQVKRRGA